MSRCASGSCTPGTAGVVKTDCVTSAAGPNAVAAPVQTCVAGSTNGLAGLFRDDLHQPAGDQLDRLHDGGACGTPGVTVPVAAPMDHDRLPQAGRREQRHRLCRSAPLHQRSRHGASLPEGRLHDGRDSARRRSVPPATCPVGTTYAAAPDHTVTICAQTRRTRRRHRWPRARRPTPDVPLFIVTTCGYVRNRHAGAASCDVGAPASGDGADWVTCVKPGGANNAGPTQVATCTARCRCAPNFVKVTCAGSTTTAGGRRVLRGCAGSSQQSLSATQTHHLLATAPRVPIRSRRRCRAARTESTRQPDHDRLHVLRSGQQLMAPSHRAVHGGSRDRRRQPGRDDLHRCPMSRDLYVPTADVSGEHSAESEPGRRSSARRRRRSATPSATCAVGVASGVAVRHHHGVLPGRHVGDGRLRRPLALRARPGCRAKSVRCNLRPIDVLVADAGLRPTATWRGLKTTCTTSFGDGAQVHRDADEDGDHDAVQRRRAERRGRGRDDESPARRTSTTSAMRLPQTFTAQPPVDIAGCSAWPCTDITVLPRRQRELARRRRAVLLQDRPARRR